MKKLIMFGIPIFLVQLVAVYFVITKFAAPPAQGATSAHETAAPEKESHGGEKGGEHEGGEGSTEQNIYVVKDVIVNPAGTNGTRFLLTTVGFEVSSPETVKEIEAKDVQVRDALNTILTSKPLAELVDVAGRESLRKEITTRVNEILKGGSLTNVYFSKFIIQ